MSASTRSSAHSRYFCGLCCDEVVVHVGEHGVVDLQHQAGLVDLEIFLAQRLGDREHIVALARIVLVARVVADARRRDRGEETSSTGACCGGRLQIGEIARARSSWP